MGNSLYCPICLPLCFGRASRDQSCGPRDRETSLPPAVDQSNLSKLLLIPLCFGRASRDQSSGAGDWKASLPPASPLDLGVEVLLQLEDVIVLLLQAQAGDGPRQGKLGGAHSEDTQDGHHLQQEGLSIQPRLLVNLYINMAKCCHKDDINQ